MFFFLTIVQAIVAAALVGVVLMQRSEGGGLGIGGSPGGMMSARGAADVLTRATKWLAVAFVVLSIVLAALAVETSGTNDITTTLDRSAPVAPVDPLAGSADPLGAPAADPAAGPAPAASAPANDDPLAGATQ